jgi:hypothetical protein
MQPLRASRREQGRRSRVVRRGGESPGLHGMKWRKVGDTPPDARSVQPLTVWGAAPLACLASREGSLPNGRDFYRRGALLRLEPGPGSAGDTPTPGSLLR